MNAKELRSLIAAIERIIDPEQRHEAWKTAITIAQAKSDQALLRLRQMATKHPELRDHVDRISDENMITREQQEAAQKKLWRGLCCVFGGLYCLV